MAGCVAGMDKIIAATIEYTSQRQAFGQSILDNQYVHYRIAELQTEVSSPILLLIIIRILGLLNSGVTLTV